MNNSNQHITTSNSTSTSSSSLFVNDNHNNDTSNIHSKEDKTSCTNTINKPKSNFNSKSTSTLPLPLRKQLLDIPKHWQLSSISSSKISQISILKKDKNHSKSINTVRKSNKQFNYNNSYK